jgi:hypothetical protein
MVGSMSDQPQETPTRDRIMALLSPPSQDVHLTVEDARWIKEEIERLQATVEHLQDTCKEKHDSMIAMMNEALDLRAALKDVDRWLAVFIAAWDKSRDKKKPSEAPVAMMEAIRQHSAIQEALRDA